MSDLKTSLENRAVERLYAERRDFIIIGLTGRTGCGCTTVGKLLSKELKALQPPCPHRTDSISERSDKIIYDFSQNWKAFHLIEMKHVIFTFILDNPFDKLIEFVRQFGDTADLLSFEETYTKLHQERLRLKKSWRIVPISERTFQMTKICILFISKLFPMNMVRFRSVLTTVVHTQRSFKKLAII